MMYYLLIVKNCRCQLHKAGWWTKNIIGWYSQTIEMKEQKARLQRVIGTKSNIQVADWQRRHVALYFNQHWLVIRHPIYFHHRCALAHWIQVLYVCADTYDTRSHALFILLRSHNESAHSKHSLQREKWGTKHGAFCAWSKSMRKHLFAFHQQSLAHDGFFLGGSNNSNKFCLIIRARMYIYILYYK